MYDYFLGGHHNFSVDRAAAEQVLAANPDIRLVMQANRAFLRRAVTFLIGQGIDQFLDIGSGIPTVGNVHEIAQSLNPAARIVYVDNDPVAVAQSAALLADNPGATVVQADARDPRRVFEQPNARRLLDLSRPLGVLLVAFRHFLADDAEVERLVGSLRDSVVPGSFLAISHAASEAIETFSPEVIQRSLAVYERSTAPLTLRSRAQIERLFAGFDLEPPGLVPTPLWRPEGPDDVFLDRPERAGALAGIGRKR